MLSFYRGKRGNIAYDPIIHEIGRGPRVYFKETRNEWLMRRYEDSMFRERDVCRHLCLNRSEESRRNNFRWAYYQACVHLRLQTLYQEVLECFYELVGFDISEKIARLATEPDRRTK